MFNESGRPVFSFSFELELVEFRVGVRAYRRV